MLQKKRLALHCLIACAGKDTKAKKKVKCKVLLPFNDLNIYKRDNFHHLLISYILQNAQFATWYKHIYHGLVASELILFHTGSLLLMASAYQKNLPLIFLQPIFIQKEETPIVCMVPWVIPLMKIPWHFLK